MSKAFRLPGTNSAAVDGELPNDVKQKQLAEAKGNAGDAEVTYIGCSPSDNIIFKTTHISRTQKKASCDSLKLAGYTYGTKPTKNGKTARGWSKTANSKPFRKQKG